MIFIIQLIADVFIAIGIVIAIVYCFTVNKRLKKISNLEGEVGNAVALLSCQVDELQASFEKFKENTEVEKTEINDLLKRASVVRSELETQISQVKTLKDTGIYQEIKPKQPREAVFARRIR